MTAILSLFTSLKEQMNATLSRSDVLKPLVFLVGMLLASTVALAIGKADTWILVGGAILTFLAVLLYGFAYVFCLYKDRDALRSEKYTLHKLALERGLIGDSQSGVFEEESPAATPKTIETTSKRIGQNK